MKFLNNNVMLYSSAFLLASFLTACGNPNELSGEYGQSEANQWFTIFEFKDKGEVIVSLIGSESRRNGTYTREGDMVSITVDGDTRTLRIVENGCIDGGTGSFFFSGLICKKP